MPAALLPITSGRRVASLGTGCFRVTEAEYPAHFAVPPHEHATASLTFVLRGELHERLPGRAERIGPRGVLLKPPGMVHSDAFGDRGARLLLVELLPAVYDGCAALRRALGRADRVPDAPDPRLVAALSRVHAELRRRDDYSALVVEGLLLELVAGLARATQTRTASDATSDPAPWLGRVRDRLHAEFRRPLRIAELARDEGVSPMRLSRDFRRRYGCGIGEYLRRVRLRWVAGALLGSDVPIGVLAGEAGFADQSHLTRDFRAAFGVTPGAYRREA